MSVFLFVTLSPPGLARIAPYRTVVQECAPRAASLAALRGGAGVPARGAGPSNRAERNAASSRALGVVPNPRLAAVLHPYLQSGSPGGRRATLSIVHPARAQKRTNVRQLRCSCGLPYFAVTLRLMPSLTSSCTTACVGCSCRRRDSPTGGCLCMLSTCSSNYLCAGYL